MQMALNSNKKELTGMVKDYANYAAKGDTSSQAAQDLAGKIKETSQAIQEQESAINTAVSAATKLASGYKEAGSGSKSLATTITAQQSALNQLKSKYVEVATSQGKNSAEAKKLASEIKSLSSSLAGNRSDFQAAAAAADSYDASLEKASGSVEGFSVSGSAMGTMLGNIASKGLEKAVSAGKDFAKDVIQTGMNLEDSMAEVAAISGTTVGSDTYNQLKSAAQEMGRTTQFNSSEAASALKYMSLAGWDANKSIESLPAVLDLAASSQMDLGQASDIVTDYMSAFSNSNVTAAQMVDMMAFAQNNSNTSTTQLADAYKNCAANMNASGQSIQTTTAFLEAMANQGSKGSEAGTQVAAMMRDVTQKMENGAIKIGDTSVAVQDANGNFRDMMDIITDVSNATEGMGTAEKAAALSATFTSDSMKGVNMLMAEGMDKVQGYSAALDESGGAAAKAAATMNSTLSGRLTALDSAFSGVKESIYDGIKQPLTDSVSWVIDNIMPKLQSAADGFRDFMPKVTETFKNMGNGLKDMLGPNAGPILAATAGIAGIGVGALTLPKVFSKLKALNPFSFLGKSAKDGMDSATKSVSSQKSKLAQVFTGIGDGIGKAFQGIGKGINSALAGFGAMGPMGAASFAITVGTITAALIALSACSGTVTPFLKDLSNIFQDLAAGTVDIFVNAILKLSPILPTIAQSFAMLAPLVEAFGTAFGNAAPFVSALGSAIGQAADGIGSGLAKIIGALAPNIDAIGNFLNTFISNVSTGISQIVTAFQPLLPGIQGIITAIQPIFSDLVNAFNTLVSNISPIIDSLNNTLSEFKGIIETSFNGVQGVIESAGNAIKGVLDSIAGIFDSIGNAAKNAGQGFEAMGRGIRIITSLNLLDMAASLGAVALGAAEIGAASGGMAQVGEGFMNTAKALVQISSSGQQALIAFTMLQHVASTAGATISELQSHMGNLDSATSIVKSSMMSTGLMVSLAAAQISTGLTSIQTGLTTFTATAAMFTAAAALINIGLNQMQTALSNSGTGFTVMSTQANSLMSSLTSLLSAVTSLGAGFRTILNVALQNAGTAFSNMAAQATTAMTLVSTSVVTSMTTATTTVSTATTTMVTTFTSGMMQMGAAVTAGFAGVTARINAAMSSAVAAVRSGIAQMRAACSVTIQGPNIRLPHISVSGSFSLDPPSAPQFSVSWYKKGGILDGAQIFGMAGGRLLGGGEAGKEAVLPLSELWDNMERIFTNAIAAVAAPQTELANAGRMVNADAGVSRTGHPVTIEFNPVININNNGGNSSAAPSRSDLLSLLRQARDEFEDFLDEYFEDKGGVVFG